MAAFKTLNSQDIIVSPLQVDKGFSYKGNALTASNVNIERYLGNKFATTSSAKTGDSYVSQSAVYYSIRQLYYSNYVSSSNGDVQIANTQSIQPDGTILGRIGSNAYYDFPQTSLTPSKYFPTSSYQTLTLAANKYGTAKYGVNVYGVNIFQPKIAVMSIPKALFGDNIQPKSLKIITPSGSYFDDGEGRLRRSTPLLGSGSSVVVGNVIYNHGMVILTGGSRKQGTGENSLYSLAEYGAGIYGGRTVGNADVENFWETVNITASFSSSFTIYETQYKCTLQQDEFNYSQNPTTVRSGSNSGVVYNYVTSSFFSPYITTVGMYNEANELLAVGKLAQPLPTSQTTDTTILVNIDRQ